MRPSGDWSWRVILRPFWDPFWTLSGPYLGNLIKNHENCPHLAVGRAYLRICIEYGSREGVWWGTGIALPSPPSIPLPRVHPSPPHHRCTDVGVRTEQSQHAVGLISVDQLTLGTHISRFRGMTEVYNLIKAGIPNDQKCIPGNE